MKNCDFTAITAGISRVKKIPLDLMNFAGSPKNWITLDDARESMFQLISTIV